MKTITYSRQAAKTMSRMPIEEANRIYTSVKKYADTGTGDVVRMKGVAFFRLRVGGWRVVFDDDGLVVAVEKIAPRGEVYKKG